MDETTEELRPGLVLHLDPNALEQRGGQFTCSPSHRVKGGHFFILLVHEDDAWTMAPLYEEDRRKARVPVGRDRSGHGKWTDGTFHVDRLQTWSAPPAAIIKAARAGDDRSAPGARNRLNEPSLGSLLDDLELNSGG